MPLQLSAAPFSNMHRPQPLTVTLATPIVTPAGNATVSGSSANMIPYQIPPTPLPPHVSSLFWVTSEFATALSGQNFIETEVTESKSITLLGRMTSYPSGSDVTTCSLTVFGEETTDVPPPATRTSSRPSTRSSLDHGRIVNNFYFSSTARPAVDEWEATGHLDFADWYVQRVPGVPQQLNY